MKIRPKAPGTSLYILLSSTGSLFLSALLVMLFAGVLHSVHPTVPTVDYWSTFSVLFILRSAYYCVVTDWDKKAREDLDQ